MRRETKRGGFTLIELLIVIVVIGILAAMMLLSSTEAVSTAKANNIIANLRNLKTAALAWYVDSFDQLADVDVGTVRNDNFRSTDPKKYWNCVKRYLTNEADSQLDTYYSLVSSSGNSNQNQDKSIWFIMYANKDLDIRVKQKLAGRAKSVGLLREAKPESKPYGKTENGGANNFNNDKGQWVFMQVK